LVSNFWPVMMDVYVDLPYFDAPSAFSFFLVHTKRVRPMAIFLFAALEEAAFSTAAALALTSYEPKLSR
jgi:hypothetical protein